MDWNQMSGVWEQAKGRIKEQWGKLTDDDLKEAGGNRDKLVGKIGERYGLSKEEAEQKFSEWEGKVGGVGEDLRGAGGF